MVGHITDLENPKIAVGVTFEDRDTFMRAIRQYAILNEVEIVARYNEARRYRGYCKAKKCKYHICRMKGHGRLRRCLTSIIAREQVKYRTIAWLINSGLGIE